MSEELENPHETEHYPASDRYETAILIATYRSLHVGPSVVHDGLTPCSHVMCFIPLSGDVTRHLASNSIPLHMAVRDQGAAPQGPHCIRVFVLSCIAYRSRLLTPDRPQQSLPTPPSLT